MPHAKGFTLIELLVYIGISSAVLLLASLFLSVLLETRIKHQAIMEVKQQGIFVMQSLTRAIRNADTLNTPTQGASGATLSLNTFIAQNNPTTFDLSGGTIRITESAESPIFLTNARVTASGLVFQNLSRPDTPPIIRIQFTLTHTNPDGKNEYAVSKTFTTSAALYAQ